MNFVIDEKSLAGKTVETAAIVDGGESISIKFTDDSCVFIKAKTYGDCAVEIDLREESQISNRDLLEGGLINDNEYKEREKILSDKQAENRKNRELEQLAALKRKYPDV